jgi:hypothetical protein
MAAEHVRELRNRPSCARCNSPVEHFEEVFDDFLCRVVFVARCHGDVERVVLSRVELALLDSGRLHFARAFVQPLLLEAEK